MKNGNITEFMDKLYLGEELLFEYKELEYFIQGWNENATSIMVVDCYTGKPFENYFWKCKATTMLECAEAFLNAEIWDGKSFLQIQNDVTWKN